MRGTGRGGGSWCGWELVRCVGWGVPSAVLGTEDTVRLVVMVDCRKLYRMLPIDTDLENGREGAINKSLPHVSAKDVDGR